MDNFLQAMVMSFREGLEAFLIVTIILKFLDKSGNQHLKTSVWKGTFGGIGFSLAVGLLLYIISTFIGGLDVTAKFWESVAGLIAVGLITTFIIWMIKHGSSIKHHIENEVSQKLTGKGVMILTLFMVAREGTEIAIFSFAGKYTFASVTSGLLLSVILVTLLYYSLVKVNLKVLFNITLAYLILQTGYLLGYSIHEGLSAMKGLGWLEPDNVLFTKAFNLYETIFNHKKGGIGLPLNVLIGWYSKPEWIQFILQYSTTALLFIYWLRKKD